MTGCVIAACPSFSLIAAYELLIRQIRNAAEAGTSWRGPSRVSVANAVAPRRSKRCADDQLFQGSGRHRHAARTTSAQGA